MKTKDFIKMLQEADPTGEAYIRWGEGVPYHAELKDGYWDGSLFLHKRRRTICRFYKWDEGRHIFENPRRYGRKSSR